MNHRGNTAISNREHYYEEDVVVVIVGQPEHYFEHFNTKVAAMVEKDLYLANLAALVINGGFFSLWLWKVNLWF
jgi:hypothetical protein